MNNRPLKDLPLTVHYDDIYADLSSKYAALLKESEDPIREASNKKRYKEYRYVLIEFLKLYEVRRAPDHSSYLAKTQWLFQKFKGVFTGREPTIDVINKINQEVPEAIREMNSLSGVLKLIISLRKYAEIAQGEKTLDGASLLCLTLHAMAGYLIFMCKDDFKLLIDQLEKEKNDLLLKPKEDYEKNNGVNVGNLNARYCIVTVALAFLNVFEGVNSASRMGKLPYYVLPTTLEKDNCSKKNIAYNHGLPLAYQEACIHYVYENSYSTDEKKTFNDFLRYAYTGSVIADNEANKKQKDSQLRRYDYLFVPAESIDINQLPGNSPFAYVLTPKGIWYVERSKQSMEKVHFSEKELAELMKTHQLQEHINTGQKQAQSPRVLENLSFEDILKFEEKRLNPQGSDVALSQPTQPIQPTQPTQATQPMQPAPLSHSNSGNGQVKTPIPDGVPGTPPTTLSAMTFLNTGTTALTKSTDDFTVNEEGELDLLLPGTQNNQF